jgi:hypothetical protein
MISFKDYFMNKVAEEISATVNDNIGGVMGGIAGHMSHPFEVLSADDLLLFFEEMIDGNMRYFEKVDGVNLFVGFDDDLQICYARNKTDKPNRDINIAFPITHPAHDTFTAGFTAIKTSIEKLSVDKLIHGGLIKYEHSKLVPNKWINLEIIYGEIPNIIQYSATTNYIVFHNLTYNPLEGYESLTKEESSDQLYYLEKELGSTTVNTPVVSYLGNPKDSVERIVDIEESTWVFKGPIEINPSVIKNDLKCIADTWRSFESVKKLANHKQLNLTENEIQLTMKEVTKDIGSQALRNITSSLFSGMRKTDDSYPKIEGLAVDYNNTTIKITGDFMQVNQDLWAILNRDGENSLKYKVDLFYEYIMNDLLHIPKIKTITKTSWAKSNSDPIEYLKLKGEKKFYKDETKFTEDIEIEPIMKMLDDTNIKLYEISKEVAEGNNIKKADILKTINIAALKFSNFREYLESITATNRKDLLFNFAKAFFIN